MKLLTEGEVSEFLGVTRSCLRRWRGENRFLPVVRVGRLVRYRQADIENFINSNLQEVGAKPEVSKEVEVGA